MLESKKQYNIITGTVDELEELLTSYTDDNEWELVGSVSYCPMSKVNNSVSPQFVATLKRKEVEAKDCPQITQIYTDSEMISKLDRTVEILKEGAWKPIEFIKLKKYDIFRLFDDRENGGKNLIMDQRGNTQFIAFCDPYIGPTGILQIDTGWEEK